MAKKLQKTLADYVVGGVMPALLIGLLCSLCYFLLELAYSGAYTGQLKWILFFFIVGTVLIARISMRGDISERAGIYGIGLGIAALLAIIRFAEIPKSALGGFGWLIPVSLMSIIWWSAHKLTQDSTQEEDDEDGGGLLDAPTAIESGNNTATRSEAWFDKYQSERQEEQRRKRPGIMVVFFSLAALPLFGMGQAMIPASQVEARRYAFWLLTIYVGCGLGMLLTTSFLGLRRYLRGRRLQMPATMTALWLGIGSAMILILMVLSAVLLPRPEAEYHVSQLLGWMTSKERDANKTHFFEGSSGKSDQSGTGPKNTPPQGSGGQASAKGSEKQSRQEEGPQQNRKAGNKQKGQPDPQGQPASSGEKSSGRNPGNRGDSGSGGQSEKALGSGAQNSSKQQSQPSNSGKQSSSGKDSSNTAGKELSQASKTMAKQNDSKDASDNPQQNRRQDGNQGEKGEQRSSSGPSKDNQSQNNPEDQRNQEGEPGNRKDKQDGSDQNQASAQKQQQRSNHASQDQSAKQQPPDEQGGSAEGVNQFEENRPPPSELPTPNTSWDWLKWIFYALILAGILFAIWKWGRYLWETIVQMWREFLTWWNVLLPGHQQKENTSSSEELDSHLPPKPFSWYSNPLQNPGNFRSMEEMIRYSFAALHSWAYEQNLGRTPDETPTEFAQRLGASVKYAHQDIRKLSDLYSIITYAKVHAPASSETILRNFWQRLSQLPDSKMEEEEVENSLSPSR